MHQALQQLEAPAHVLGLAKPGGDQLRLLRYLHLRYLQMPDDGQHIATDTIQSWATSLGVVASSKSPTATATTTPTPPIFSTTQLLQLTETVASVISHDDAHQHARPDPSTSLLTSVASDPSVFSTECQLFPFDLQWIVNAANAAPGQFTPSMDGIQAELEITQVKCRQLQELDEISFEPSSLNATLQRTMKSTKKMHNVALDTSKLLHAFSNVYRERMMLLAESSKEPRIGSVGEVACDLAPKLRSITTLMDQLKRSKVSVERIEKLKNKMPSLNSSFLK